MTANSTPIRPEDLLSHLTWLKNLASILVRDPSRADDLAQDTLLSAMRTPPDANRPLRPWLSRVLSNRWRDIQRGESNRAMREEKGASPEFHEQSPAALAHEVDLGRTLADCVLALPTELRETVLERFYAGHSSAEIARRSNIPSATVRWRLSRALEELRRQLDALHDGDRKQWCLAFAPLAHKAPALGVGGATGTGASASLATWAMWSTAVAAIMLTTFSVIQIFSEPEVKTIALDEAHQLAGAEASHELAEDLPSSKVTAPEQAEDPARQSIATSKTPDSAQGSTGLLQNLLSQVAPSNPLTTFSVRFLHPDGNPLQGVSMIATSLGQTMRWESDSNGRIYVESNLLDRKVEASIRATKDDLIWIRSIEVNQGDAIDLGDVHLVQGCRISGLVMDSGGSALGDALVVAADGSISEKPIINRLRGPGNKSQQTTTDEEGRFSFLLHPEGLAHIWAQAPSGWVHSEQLWLESGKQYLRLQAPKPKEQSWLGVLVLDPDGDPVPHASLHYQSGFAENWLTADENGYAPIGDLAASTSLDLLKVSDPSSKLAELVLRNISGGQAFPNGLPLEGDSIPSHTIVVQLQEPATQLIRVQDPEGNAIESFGVECREANDTQFRGLDPRPITQVHNQDGLAATLVRHPSFELFVESNGFLPYRSSVLTQIRATALVITLQPAKPLCIRVLADGKPAAQATASLYELVAPNQLLLLEGCPSRVQFNPVCDSTADSDGLVELFPSKAGRYSLYVEHGDWAKRELGPLEINPAQDSSLIEVELMRPGSLRGRVIDGIGNGLAGISLRATNGGPDIQSTTSGREGEFYFERLEPGPWYVFPVLDDSNKNTIHMVELKQPWKQRSNAELRPNEESYVEVLLENEVDAVLEGRLEIAGQEDELSLWTVSLLPWRTGLPYKSSRSWDAKVMGDGSFRIEAPVGDYALNLSRGPIHNPQIVLSTKLEIQLGLNQWETKLQSATLSGRLNAGRHVPESWYRFEAELDNNLRAFASLKPNQNGEFELPFIPAGPGRITHWTSVQDGPGELAQFHALPGEDTWIAP